MLGCSLVTVISAPTVALITRLPHYHNTAVLLANIWTHHILVDISKLAYSYFISRLPYYSPTPSLVPDDTSLLHCIYYCRTTWRMTLLLCHNITLAYPNRNANLEARRANAGRYGSQFYIPSYCSLILLDVTLRRVKLKHVYKVQLIVSSTESASLLTTADGLISYPGSCNTNFGLLALSLSFLPSDPISSQVHIGLLGLPPFHSSMSLSFSFVTAPSS